MMQLERASSTSRGSGARWKRTTRNCASPAVKGLVLVELVPEVMSRQLAAVADVSLDSLPDVPLNRAIVEHSPNYRRHKRSPAEAINRLNLPSGGIYSTVTQRPFGYKKR